AAAARPCARTRRPVRGQHGPGEECRRSGLGQRVSSHRSRRSAEDCWLVSEIAHTQFLPLQTTFEVGARLEAARRELANGTGVLKTAKLVGLGTGTVQRLKREIALA